MNKLIEVLIAAFFFIIIVFVLIPMLPIGKLADFTLIVVIFFAIIFCLGEIGGYPWPWIKK